MSDERPIGIGIGMPDAVRIGPYRYDVRVEDGPFDPGDDPFRPPSGDDDADDDAAKLCGEACHNSGLIRVMRASADRMFAVLWHEILHGIDEMAGTGLTEDQIGRLAPILAGALMDNGYADRGREGDAP